MDNPKTNNRIRTGNSVEVLHELFKETEMSVMGKKAMNALVEEYTGSNRFTNRLKTMYVIRWTQVAPARPSWIPFEDLLHDFAEVGLINEKVLTDSLIVRKYEQAIIGDTVIKDARCMMAAEVCVEMSIDDAIFNGLQRSTV